MQLTPSQVLTQFHAKNVGASDRVFGAGLTENGISSYQELAQAVPAGARTVLDLACGDGPLLALLRAQRPDLALTGLDRSPEELAAAARRALPDLSLVLGDAAAMPFPDASFDVVTCHMAFMLMERADQVVSELRRVLKPEGLFLAVVGRPSPKTPLMTSVFKAMQQASRDDALTISWPEHTKDEDTLRTTFTGWSLHTRPLTLRVQVPRERLWPFLRLSYYYNDLLSDPIQRRLQAEVEALAAAEQDPILPWSFGALWFEARPLRA